MPCNAQYSEYTAPNHLIYHILEPLMRIELTTSSLPRKCSTPELQRQFRVGVSVGVGVSNGFAILRLRHFGRHIHSESFSL
jgi:hypothetical protein